LLGFATLITFGAIKFVMGATVGIAASARFVHLGMQSLMS
jgi:hypothetical protein